MRSSCSNKTYSIKQQKQIINANNIYNILTKFHNQATKKSEVQFITKTLYNALLTIEHIIKYTTTILGIHIGRVVILGHKLYLVALAIHSLHKHDR